MDAVRLQRAGAWLLVIALIAGISAPNLLTPASATEQPWARHGIILGAVLLIAGFLARQIGGGKRCKRCRQRAAAGSVFCAVHRRELTQLTRQSVAAHQRDNRNW